MGQVDRAVRKRGRWLRCSRRDYREHSGGRLHHRWVRRIYPTCSAALPEDWIELDFHVTRWGTHVQARVPRSGRQFFRVAKSTPRTPRIASTGSSPRGQVSINRPEIERSSLPDEQWRQDLDLRVFDATEFLGRDNSARGIRIIESRQRGCSNYSHDIDPHRFHRRRSDLA